MTIIVRMIAAVLSLGLMAGCASTRQISIGRPVQTSSPLLQVAGSEGVGGDDFYVQFASEFTFNELDDGQSGCRELGSSYAKGGAKSVLMFQVRNDQINYQRELPGFIYETSSGRCGFSLNAKKTYLTPWMRLEIGKAVQIDYSFLHSDTSALDVNRIGNDVNTASNVLAVTGVGVGAAVVGKVASGWMLGQGQSEPASPTANTGTRREESRSLPRLVDIGSKGVTVGQIHFPVYAVSESAINPMASKPQPLGEVLVSVDLKSSLLLPVARNGVPDARDVSLEELWRTNLQSSAGGSSLEDSILKGNPADRPNLQPDPNNYRDLELNCRKLKHSLKDLGFNKFDRNAVLYYFLEKSPDWKAYNTTGQSALNDGPRLAELRRFRSRNFDECLITDDFEAMKRMGLAVNSDQDWETTLEQLAEKESYLGAIESIARQLAAILPRQNASETERQLFPLLMSSHGSGSVLLQNNLGSFGLEAALGVDSLPGDGSIVSAHQLATALATIKMTDLSCARPAFEQGRPIKNVAIMLFATAIDSPLARGGALEFQFDAGKVLRISIQSPSFRDFRQDVLIHPEFGDCRIDPAWMQKL